MSQPIANYATLVSFVQALRRQCQGEPATVEMTWEARIAIENANPRDLGESLFYSVQLAGAHGAMPTFLGLKVITWEADEVRVLGRPIEPAC